MPRQEALKEYCVGQIQERGFVSINLGINGSDIDPLFSNFREFLDVCDGPAGEKFKHALAYKIPNREDDGAYWVERRRLGETNPHEVDRAPASESKDTAHIGPQSIAVAKTRLGNGMPRVMKKFLEDCTEIHEAAKSSVRPFFRVLGVEKAMLAEDRVNDVHIIRVLRYLGTTASHQANLHFDRSKFTLAAWESRPGLVGGPGDNGYLRPVTVSELDEMATYANNASIQHQSGVAKVFAGAGYNHLPTHLRDSSGNLPLLLHGVRNEAPGEERDAVVIFMNQHTGLPLTVPRPHETGFDDVRAHIARRDSLSDIA